MAARLLRLGSVATVVLASSGWYLNRRQLDLNDLSVVRFGKAAATVRPLQQSFYNTCDIEMEKSCLQYIVAMHSRQKNIFNITLNIVPWTFRGHYCDFYVVVLSYHKVIVTLS